MGNLRDFRKDNFVYTNFYLMFNFQFKSLYKILTCPLKLKKKKKIRKKKKGKDLSNKPVTNYTEKFLFNPWLQAAKMGHSQYENAFRGPFLKRVLLIIIKYSILMSHGSRTVTRL